MAGSPGSRDSAVLAFNHASCNRNGIATVLEDRPDLAGQLFQRERFLKEVVFDIDYSMVHYRLASIARDEQHLGLRTQRFQFLRQLSSTHVRHYDVRNCQMDRRS